MKRRFRCGVTATSIALALSLFAVPSAFAAGQGPVKIGFLAPFVGVWAQNGKDMDNGFRLALEQRGYEAGGRKLQVISEDTEGKPEVGVLKTRKLIEQDKVDILAGIVNSAVALAIRDQVIERKVPLVITNAGAKNLTGTLKSPYIFRVSFANGQQDAAGGWYAYTKMGMKRMVIVSPDFVAGHEKADAFMRTFKAAGGQVVDQIYPPINTHDFGPYLTKIQAERKNIDGVWVFFVGAGAIRFVQQYDEYGLKQAVPLFVIGDTVDDSYLPSLKNTAVGIKNYCQYADTLKTPENQKFVKAYFAKYKEYPSMYSEQAYIGANVIAMALDAVKGNIENKNAFLAAMRKVQFDAPGGHFAFDADQNAIIPIYIREVEKVDGRYENVVLDKIADKVDQNWSANELVTAKK